MKANLSLFFTLFFSQFLNSQTNVSYVPFYTSASFDAKTIDQTKKVGVIAGKADASNGSANYSISIASPPRPNTANTAADFSLNYNSSAGEGIAGRGWNISGVSRIQRTQRSIVYNTNVEPSCIGNYQFELDGQKLLMVGSQNDYILWKTESENFTEIRSYSISPNTGGGINLNEDIFKWEITLKDGTILYYGECPNGHNTKIYATNSTTQNTFCSPSAGGYVSFYLDEIVYTNGLTRDYYYYYPNGRNISILKVEDDYGSINFSYKVKTDKINLYTNGRKFENDVLLDEVTVNNYNSELIKKYNFNYSTDNINSYLSSVEETGVNNSKLNSTIFLYGERHTNSNFISPQIPYLIPVNNTSTAESHKSGDFNGDGYTDVITFDQSSLVNSNKGQISAYRVYINNKNGTYSMTENIPNLTDKYFENHKDEHYNLLNSDYNGDGIDDLLTFKITQSNNNFYYSYSDLWYFKSNGYSNPTINQTYSAPVRTTSPSGTFNNIHSSFKYNYTGDFDGDGGIDQILLLSNGSTFKYFISSFKKNLIHNDLVMDNGLSYNLQNSEAIYILDFDGDSKSDIMVLNDNKCEIYSVYIGAGGTFNLKRIYDNSYPNSSYTIKFGDFNGDRKTDLFIGKTYDAFKIALSTGVDFDVQTNIFQTGDIYPNIVKDNNTCDIDYVDISDFNGDGKSDILHIYTPLNTCDTKIATYFSKGLGFTKKIFNSNSKFYFDCINRNTYDIINGDFNADGIADISTTVVNGNSSFYQNCSQSGGLQLHHRQDFYFNDKFDENLLVKVKNGLGAVSSFSYSSLSKLNISRTYDGSSHYNNNLYYSVPLKVVTQFSDETSNKALSFNYYGAMMSRKGRGFLGFRKQEMTDNIMDEKTITYYNKFSFLTNFPDIVFNDYIEKEKGGTIVETSRFYYSQGNTSNLVLWLRNDKVEISSYLTGNTISEFTYDNYGNNLTKSILNPDGRTILTTTNFGTNGANRPPLPISSTITYSKAGLPNISYVTNFEYNSKNQLSKKIDFANLPKTITTEYLYNTLGNVTEEKLTGTGMPVRKTETIYTPDDRYVVKKKNSLGQETIFVMSDLWNQPLSITDVTGLTTTFTYDDFGRTLSENLPDGKQIVSDYIWDNSISFTSLAGNVQSRFKIKKYSPNRPSIISETFFDHKQRSIGSKNQQFDGTFNTTQQFFDDKNRPYKTLNYNSTGQFINGKEFEYDAWNREITAYYIEQNGTSTLLNTASYTKSNNFWEIVKSVPASYTNPSGSSNYTKISLGGEQVESNENGVNTLNYQYNTEGKLLKVLNGSTVITESEYDNYGRQVKLIDKSAGTQLYEFNILGELVKQTNSNNGFVNIEYDILGRKTKEIINEGTISYTYFSTGIGMINKIKEKKGPNLQNKEEYSYDNLGRVVAIKQTIAGSPVGAVGYTNQFIYNSNGELSQRVTPSGNGYVYFYNSVGVLNQIKKGLPSYKVIYSLNSTTNTGKPSNYNLGSSQVNLTYDNLDRIESIVSDKIEDSYTWDPINGNLGTKYEYNSLAPNARTFSYIYQYDNMDRLTQEFLNVGRPIIKNLNYQDDGRIEYKNSVSFAPYAYHNNKIFAVANIFDADNFSPYNQTIAYSSFNKATSLTQDGYNLTFNYGPDNVRFSTILKKNGAIQNKRFYCGYTEFNYNASNSQINSIDYIYAGDRLVAMDVNKSSQSEIWYVQGDYQNSARAVFNDAGQVYYQNFDAWGNWRDNDMNSTTLGDIVYDRPTNLPNWLNTGYIGQEHLPEFRLINLNARLYDPHVGRMLSPDNYVTANSLQGFNRYSYAHNNPLKYSDPDGNMPLLASFVIGTVTNVLQKGFTNLASGNDFFAGGTWETWVFDAVSSGVMSAFTTGIGSAFGPVGGGAIGFGKVGTEIARAGAHGLLQGLYSDMLGGSFFSGFASGAISSGLGSAQMMYAPGLGTAGGYAVSALGGGIGAELSGGSFKDGAITGLLIHGLNHLTNVGVQRIVKKMNDVQFKKHIKAEKNRLQSNATAELFMGIGNKGSWAGVVESAMTGTLSGALIPAALTYVCGYVTGLKNQAIAGTLESVLENYNELHKGQPIGQYQGVRLESTFTNPTSMGGIPAVHFEYFDISTNKSLGYGRY